MKPALVITVVMLLGLAMGLPVPAQEPMVFKSAELEKRFGRLTNELRCLVCQNQSLADSDAPLAHDLRQEVWLMLDQGKTDREIKQFLVDRYGEFVLYQPPVQGNTLVLWLGPGLLLSVGAAIAGFSISRRKTLLNSEPGEQES